MTSGAAVPTSALPGTAPARARPALAGDRAAGPRAAARPWRRALAWLALLAPFFYLSYGLANQLAATRASVPSVVFDWEWQVPFWGWTIFPYWSLNLFYGLSLLLARDRHQLDRHAARLLTAQCLAVACFIAWPLRFSFGQPPVDGAAGWLFAALRSFDQPFNQAPSLHITLVVILWDLYRRLVTGRVARWVLHGWALAICGSVLTTWQHHFIDIPTGALLGLLCVWAWPLERRAAMASVWLSRSPASIHKRRYACRYAVAAMASGALAMIGRHSHPALLWLCWPAVSLALVALNYAGLGARGFQMDRHGRMAWAARWLLAPYRLGALVNAWLWTRRLPALRPVRPGLYLGSVGRLALAGMAGRQLNGLAVGAPGRATGALPGDTPTGCTLVSLCAELQAPANTTTLCLPWLDLVPASPRALRRAAATIDRAVQQGRPVVVGCALGFSRSAAAVACWLTRAGHARDLDEALAQLRQAHPQMVLGTDWLAALRHAVKP